MARPAVDVCGLWRAKGIDADGQHLDEAFILSANETGRGVVGTHVAGTDPAEHFNIEECVLKDAPVMQGEDGKDLPAAVLLSFVQRYTDPDVMPTRWQARLEPPGMVGWW